MAKEEYLKGRNLQVKKSTFNRFMKEIASENARKGNAAGSSGAKLYGR